MNQPGAALIAVALCLMCLAAQAQEPIRANSAAGTHKATEGKQQAASTVRNPDAVICSVSVHNAAPGTTIPIPSGRNYTDFCPEAKLVRAFYYNRPGVVYLGLPKVSGVPAPLTANNSGGHP